MMAKLNFPEWSFRKKYNLLIQETFLINAENSYSTNFFCENRVLFFWTIWWIIFDE